MRFVAWLMYLVSAGQLAIDHLRFAGDVDARRLKRRLQDVGMRATAAEIPGTAVPDSVGGRTWMVLQ
jgi:hypothetical protein